MNAEPTPLYARVLGDAWHRLPDAIRQMHVPGSELRAEGRARVERGSGPFAPIVAAVFGFPPAGDDVPVSVTFSAKDGRELWVRDFAGARFQSAQRQGEGREAHLVIERFGPFDFGLQPVIDGDKMRLLPRFWRLLGLPLPAALAPGGEAFETVIDGRFHFHVEIGLPLIGRIVRYRGYLVPSSEPQTVPVTRPAD